MADPSGSRPHPADHQGRRFPRGVSSVHQAYHQNIEAVLKAANMTLGNIVKANVYLTNLAQDFDAVNEVRIRFMISGR